MQKFKTELQSVEVVEDTLCNKCGESCGKDEYPYGLIEAKVCGGYNSPRLSDGHAYKFSLCEDCLAGLFLEFKISAFDPSRSRCGCNEDDLK